MRRILKIILCCTCFCLAPDDSNEDLRASVARIQNQITKQSVELNTLINKIDGANSATQESAHSFRLYLSVFKDAVNTFVQACIKVNDDLGIAMSILSDLTTSLAMYSIVFIIASILSYIVCRFIIANNSSLISRLFRIFAKSAPYMICLLFYYLPILALGLDVGLPNILNFTPGVAKYFYFLSQITFIFLVRNLIIQFLDILKGSEYFLPTIKPVILNIAAIRVLKITLAAFVLITEYSDMISFEEKINQIEMSLIFLVITYFVFRLRNLVNIRNVHIGSVLKYISLPIFLSGLFAYISNSNEASLVYKLIISISTLPLLNKLYALLRYYAFNYLKTFNKEGITYLIQIFLLTMGFFRILLIPLSIVIITAVFDVNLIAAIYSFLGAKASYLLIMAPFLFIFSRILFVFNMYFWSLYEHRHISVRPFDKQRIQTFAIIMKNFTAAMMVMILIFVFLSMLGLDISPLFQSVGFVSAALSLSLQEFIRDIVNGLFVLYDNSIKVGDLIEFEKRTAIVEVMHVRYIRIRFDDGLLITIPFHKIEIILNKSRQQSYIILNVSLARNVDVESAENAIQEAFKNIREKPEFKYKILKDIEMRDIAEVTAFSYILQCRICVQPNSQYKIKRALNRELKLVFDKYGIDLAFPPVANATNVPALSTGDSLPDFQ